MCARAYILRCIYVLFPNASWISGTDQPPEGEDNEDPLIIILLQSLSVVRREHMMQIRHVLHLKAEGWTIRQAVPSVMMGEM
nr:hypothetical protein Iba_chr05dCG15670 [Ipomoea batatas]